MSRLIGQLLVDSTTDQDGRGRHRQDDRRRDRGDPAEGGAPAAAARRPLPTCPPQSDAPVPGRGRAGNGSTATVPPAGRRRGTASATERLDGGQRAFAEVGRRQLADGRPDQPRRTLEAGELVACNRGSRPGAPPRPGPWRYRRRSAGRCRLARRPPAPAAPALRRDPWCPIDPCRSAPASRPGRVTGRTPHQAPRAGEAGLAACAS